MTPDQSKRVSMQTPQFFCCTRGFCRTLGLRKSLGRGPRYLSLRHSPALTSLPETQRQMCFCLPTGTQTKQNMLQTRAGWFRWHSVAQGLNVEEELKSFARAACRVMLVLQTDSTQCCWNAAESHLRTIKHNNTLAFYNPGIRL